METYKIITTILSELERKIAPGVALLEINQWGKELMDKFGVESADYQYKPPQARTPFPGYLCTSVNDTICHGVPTAYRLAEGDLINIDVGIKMKGQPCADAAFSLPVGKVANKDMRLLRYAKRTLYAGIERIRDGVSVTEIAEAMDSYARMHNYLNNRLMSGHAIGAEMHMQPYIPAVFENDPEYKKYFTGVLKEGMIVCLEPMVTYGKDQNGYFASDFWTYLTRDHKNSAMFEHMVRVEKDGYTILTTHFDETWYERGGKYEQ